MRACRTVLNRIWRLIGHSGLPLAQSLLSRVGAFAADRREDFEVPLGDILYHGSLHYLIDRHIYFSGGYALAELDFLKKAAAVVSRRTKAVTMLDIGANVGQHSLALHRYIGRILAFEPSQEAAVRLRRNIAANRISNIEVHEVALGDRDEMAWLGSGLPGNDGSRSLSWTLSEAESTAVIAGTQASTSLGCSLAWTE